MEPSNKPSRKVVVGTAVGASMTIIAWSIKAFAGVEVPAEVALAGSTVVVFLIQYFVPNADL